MTTIMILLVSYYVLLSVKIFGHNVGSGYGVDIYIIDTYVSIIHSFTY